MAVDEVFALYLFEWSKLTNKSYYRQVIYFTILYRECLNTYGWLKNIGSHQKVNRNFLDEFCLYNTAQLAPTVCNEFLTHNKDIKLQKRDTIDLIVNLCHWLYSSKFTNIKLKINIK